MASPRARNNNASASTLLLDEYFASGDDRFVDEVLASSAGKKLKAVAQRWLDDRRPFARRTLLAYIDDGCDRPHHRPLVKALFKLAERRHDDELIGHFMVAFDRYVRRKLVEVDRYDWRKRQSYKEKVLSGDGRYPQRYHGKPRETEPHFSARTRRYLARRAMRYFRYVGHKDPARYGRAIRLALALYRDPHLDKPEHLLDAWGLVHALYHGSPVLDRRPQGVRLASGQALADLAPAPLYPDAWRGCFDEVFALLGSAQSRPVRAFAIAWLKAEYASRLDNLSIAQLRPLLASPHDEVQVFASEMLRAAEGLSRLTIAEWLDLLRIENPTALGFLCEAIARHVSPARLSLEQTIELAQSSVAPVAELGLSWTKSKPIKTRAALDAIVELSACRAPRVRAEAIAWVCATLGGARDARMDHVRDLVDARFDDVRRAGIELFERDARFKDDPALWAALSETPYDDVRAFLLAHLEARQTSFAPDTLQRLWATTLLSVHRGGRQKRTALGQIAARIVETPAEAAPLSSLLGLCLRSVRPTERRAALAAVSRAAFRAPELRATLAQKLPELTLFEEERA